MEEQEARARLRYLQLKKKAALSSAPAPQPSVGDNAMREVKEMGASSMPSLGSLTPTNPLTIGKSAYQAMTGTPMGETDLGRDIRNIPKIPGQMARSAYQSIRHPIKSFKERPIQTTMDVTTAVGLGTAAARPFVRAGGSSLGSGLEAMSGLEHKTPGVLAEAYNDAGTFFGPRKKTAQDMYRRIEDKSAIRGEVRSIPDDVALVEQAKKILDEGGTLNPDEALQARKSMDKTKKHWNETYFNDQRKRFDAVAKEKFAEADKTYVRARKAEGLRSIFPLNKTGGASAFKMALLTAGLPVMSPASQGLAATTAGVVGRKILRPVSRVAPYSGAARTNLAPSGENGMVVNPRPDFPNNLRGNGQNQANDGQLKPNGRNPNNQVTPRKILSRREAKIPTQEILLDFLRKARGDKDKARRMALDEGFDISKRGEN